MENIRKRIKELREKRGLLQKEVAEKIGVTRETINNIENGKSKGNIEMIEPLCRVLGVTPTYLILGKETSNDLGLNPEGEKLYKEYLQYLREKYPKDQEKEYKKIENL